MRAAPVGRAEVVRPGIATPRWRSACATRASTTSSTRAEIVRASSRRYIRKRGHLVVARTTGRSRPPMSAPARSMRPRSSAVWTSSSLVGHELPDSTSSAQGHRGRRAWPAGVASSSRPAECRTRAWPATRPGRRAPVASRSGWTSTGAPAHRPGRRRTGRPQADTGGRIGGGHAGSLRAWDIRVAATSRAAAPVVMTMIVSSPAMVPTMPGTEP